MSIFTRRKFLTYTTGFGGLALAEPFLPSGDVRLGVIAMGVRSHHHLRALAAMPTIRVAAIWHRDRRQAEASARLFRLCHNEPAVIADFDRLLERRDIDVLAIGPALSEKTRMLRAAAQAGKNVIIEAPAAATVDGTMQISVLAQQYGVSIEQLAHDPHWDREGVAASMASSRLGAIRRLEILDERSVTEKEAPLMDALEVAAQLLATGMPRRGLAMEAPPGAGCHLSSEIYMTDGRRLGIHVVQRLFPKGLGRSITFVAEGERGSVRTVVEAWSEERDSSLTDIPISWSRAIAAAAPRNVNQWRTTTERTARSCSFHCLLEAARPPEKSRGWRA